MGLTSTNALVAIAVSGSAAANQANGATFNVGAGTLLTFSLQSTALLLGWDLQFQDLDNPVTNSTLNWAAGQFNGLSYQLGPGARRLRYVSTVTDGASGVASVSGIVVAIATGVAITVSPPGFVQPNVTSNVTVTLSSTANIAQSAGLYMPGGGYYVVASITDATHAVLTNQGGAGSLGPGGTVPAGTLVLIAGATGAQGAAGAGTTLAAPGATITTNSSVANSRNAAYSIDASQATQITVTLGASPLAGDVYEFKLIGAMVNPVLFTAGGTKIEDPTQLGVISTGTVQCSEQGASIQYRYNGNTTTWEIRS